MEDVESQKEPDDEGMEFRSCKSDDENADKEPHINSARESLG